MKAKFPFVLIVVTAIAGCTLEQDEPPPAQATVVATLSNGPFNFSTLVFEKTRSITKSIPAGSTSVSFSCNAGDFDMTATGFGYSSTGVYAGFPSQEEYVFSLSAGQTRTLYFTLAYW